MYKNDVILNIIFNIMAIVTTHLCSKTYVRFIHISITFVFTRLLIESNTGYIGLGYKDSRYQRIYVLLSN